MDFINEWSNKSKIPKAKFLNWMALSESKFYSWSSRYGKPNAHNGKMPRDFWLDPEEVQAILDFQAKYPLEGYRRLAFMMVDQNVAFVSPTSVYRVLKDAGLLDDREIKPSKKGTGFEQPTE